MQAKTIGLALLFVIAGCVSDSPGDETGDAATAQGTPLPAVLALLDGVPEPQLDGMRVTAWHREFVTTYVKRDSQSPTNLQAAEALRGELAELGYQASIRTYVPPVFTVARQNPGVDDPTPTEPTPGAGVRVVLGIKPGSSPDRVVGLVSHYDTAQSTIEGAYDDGSGVATMMEMARLLADYPNNKTLMLIFFDAEELGLVASQAFVRDVLKDDDAGFDMIIGHDMVGINWPGHQWKMYQFMAECYLDDLRPVEEALYQELLGFPDTGVAILDVAPRNSDERRFKQSGIPVLRMAGGLNATDYPQYHQPDDTVEYLYDFVGGEANFAAGLETVVASTYWNMAYWDRAATLAPADPACYS